MVFSKPRLLPWGGTDKIFALRNVTIDLQPPRGITTLVGTSTSGKSTLAKCLLGVYKTRPGEILISNFTPFGASSSSIDLFCTGYLDHLFRQSYDSSRRVDQLLPLSSSTWLNVAIEMAKVPPTETVNNLLETQKKFFEVLLVLSRNQRKDDRYDAFPPKDPTPMLLVLDEYLDKDTPNVRRNFHRALKTLCSLSHISLQVILVTHSKGVMESFSDKVIVLQRGRVFGEIFKHATREADQGSKTDFFLPVQLSGNMIN
jgi:ABC-type sugar transport system ATPase subunit